MTETRIFKPRQGPREYVFALAAEEGTDLEHALAELEARYAALCEEAGIDAGSALFRRIFLSDAQNQAQRVGHSALARPRSSGGPCAVSLVEQPPAFGAKLALFAYHLEPDGASSREALADGVAMHRHGLTHIWVGGLCVGAERNPVPVRPQTRAVFSRLKDILSPYQATLRDHCVRTWIYVRDVDLFYAEMVAERREIFAEEGLTPDTHFIASTGIGGACSHRYDLVAMDSYAIAGLRPEQVRYLNDFSRLNAPKAYGVSFERATEIRYADRRHVFLSGTASIDRDGNVVHPGDVEAQLSRALDNAAGLLAAGGARLDDLLYLLVYLRDPADAIRIERRLEQVLPGVPRILLHAPVCRPQWLVEIEGVAAVEAEETGLPQF
jgi:enamine deaminase RidA (YjgF/YER057c/UK114 family)